MQIGKQTRLGIFIVSLAMLLSACYSITKPNAVWQVPLTNLQYPTVVNVSPSFWVHARQSTTTPPAIGKYPAKSKAELPIYTLHFMQETASNHFHKDTEHSILGNAQIFRKNPALIKEIPPIHVWKDRDGKVWTLDHRRLVSYVLSGDIHCVPVIWAPQSQVKIDTFKFSTKEQGNLIYLKLDEWHALQVYMPHRPAHPYLCSET